MVAAYLSLAGMRAKSYIGNSLLGIFKLKFPPGCSLCRRHRSSCNLVCMVAAYLGLVQVRGKSYIGRLLQCRYIQIKVPTWLFLVHKTDQAATSSAWLLLILVLQRWELNILFLNSLLGIFKLKFPPGCSLYMRQIKLQPRPHGCCLYIYCLTQEPTPWSSTLILFQSLSLIFSFVPLMHQSITKDVT